MRKSLVTAIVAVAVTATFIGGAYVGNKAKETQTAYADAVQAVGEAATTEPSTETDSVGEWIPQATNPDGSLPITDDTETVDEYVPQAVNPDCTLPNGTLPTESDTALPEIESDETETQELMVDDYVNRVSDADAVQVVPSDQVMEEMLENRNGKVIIEKMVGIVDDAEGNGHLLNGDYAYIMYGGHIANFNKGDVIVTYCVYNPESNSIDDIIARTDYVVGNVNE